MAGDDFDLILQQLRRDQARRWRVTDQFAARATRDCNMVYFQSFVSAMVATALIVVAANALLNFFLAEPRNYIPSLCVSVGFLIGHCSLSASIDDPVVGFTESCGSAVCLVILGGGFRHRATKTNVA